MKEKPICFIKGCNNPALVFMYDRYYCGPCVAKIDRVSKEKQRKLMEDALNGN